MAEKEDSQSFQYTLYYNKVWKKEGYAVGGSSWEQETVYLDRQDHFP